MMLKCYFLFLGGIVVLSQIGFAGKFEPKLGPWYEMPKYVKRSVEEFVNTYDWDKFGVDRTVSPEKLFCQGADLPMKFQVCFLNDPDVQMYPFMVVEYKTNCKLLSFYFGGVKGYFGSEYVIADENYHKICFDLRGIEAEFLETFMVQLVSKGHRLVWAQVKGVYFLSDKPVGVRVVSVPMRKSGKSEVGVGRKVIKFGGGEGWRGRPEWSARMEGYSAEVKRNGNLYLKCWGAGYNMKFANRWRNDIIDLSNYSWAKVTLRCNSITGNTDYFLIFTPHESGGIVNLMLQRDVIADGKWHRYLIPYTGRGKCKVCAVQIIPGEVKPAYAELKPIVFLSRGDVRLGDFLSRRLVGSFGELKDIVRVDLSKYASVATEFAVGRVRLSKLGFSEELKRIFGDEPDRVVDCGSPYDKMGWIDVNERGSELYLLLLARLPLSVPHPYQLGTSFSQWQISSPANVYIEVKYRDGKIEKIFPYKPGMGFRVTFGPGVYVVPLDECGVESFRVVNNMEHGRFYIVSAFVNRGDGIWRNEILRLADGWSDFPYYRNDEGEVWRSKRSVKNKNVEGRIRVENVREKKEINNEGRFWVVSRAGRFAVSGVDRSRGGNELIIYTNRFRRGPRTRTNRYGIELTVLSGKVIGVNDKGNSLIPPGGYVISVHTGSKNKNVWKRLGGLKIGDEIKIVDDKRKRVKVYDVNKEVVIDTSVGRFVVDLSDGLKWKRIESRYLGGGFEVLPEMFEIEVEDGELRIEKRRVANTPERYNRFQEVGKWMKSGVRKYNSADMVVDEVLRYKDDKGRECLEVGGNVGMVRVKVTFVADERGLVVFGKVYNLSKVDERVFDVKFPVLKGKIGGGEDVWVFMPASVGGALTGRDVSLSVPIGGYLRNRIYGVFERGNGGAVYFHHISRMASVYKRVACLEKKGKKIGIGCETSDIFCYPGGKAELGAVLIGFTDKGWYGICGEYIRWRDGWFNRPVVEDWFKKSFMLYHYHMLSFPPAGPFLHIGDNSGVWRIDEIVDEFRKFAGGVDIVDVYDWMCWRSWDDQCGDYERYTPYKNVKMFRRAVELAHKLGVRVGLFIATKLCFEYQRQWDTMVGTRSLVVRNGGNWRKNCGTYMPCGKTDVWRKYLAGVCGRAVSETGADLLYLDQCGDGEECWGVTHGHLPGAVVRDIELIRDIHRAVGKGVKLYLEGGMADYALEDFDSCIPSAVRFGNEQTMPGRIEFQRFFYPYIKFFPHHTFQQGLRDGFHWGYGFNFFQGMGYFVACMPSQWDTIGREFITKIYNLQHRYWKIFSSDDIEPLIPTLKPYVFANRFTYGKKTIYTFYNDSFKGGNLEVLEIGGGKRYFDLWNDREINPKEAGGGKVRVSIDIEPKGFGAVLVEEK